MKVAIIGHGEIGSSLAAVYRAKGIEPLVRDLNFNTINPPNTSKPKIGVLNICIPYSDSFAEDVNGYIQEYTPELTIIHSTVTVGTTKKITGSPCVHSPVRGVHPNLKSGIETFVKYIGYNDDFSLNLALQHYSEIGLDIHPIFNTDATEMAKLLSTTYYGLCIAWHGEMKKMCDRHNISFDVINLWTESYNAGYDKLNMQHVIRPNLYPPKNGIGGHCVIPNAELLANTFNSKALDLILEYDKERLKEPRRPFV